MVSCSYSFALGAADVANNFTTIFFFLGDPMTPEFIEKQHQRMIGIEGTEISPPTHRYDMVPRSNKGLERVHWGPCTLTSLRATTSCKYFRVAHLVVALVKQRRYLRVLEDKVPGSPAALHFAVNGL